MKFTTGSKVYVNYSTEIMESFTEVLTVKKYENDLLYFEEKSDYYAVECHKASFYGFSYTPAGNVIVTASKWQIPFAKTAEKLKHAVPTPTASFENVIHPTFPLQFSEM